MQLQDLNDVLLQVVVSFIGLRSFGAFQQASRRCHVVASTSIVMGTLQLLFNDRETCIREHDTPMQVTQRLLPFVRAGNVDALYLVGLIATYFFDDIEVGLGLLQRAMDSGDKRAKYELAVTMKRVSVSSRFHKSLLIVGRQYMEELASAGYIPALLACNMSRKVSSREECLAAEMEQRTTSMGLLRLLLYKQPTPDLSWWGNRCSNPCCFRKAIKANKRACRTYLTNNPWLYAYEPNQDGPNWWHECRRELMELGSSSPHYQYNRVNFYGVPNMRSCSRCERVDYCGRACQMMDWRSHKRFCVQLQQRPAMELETID